MKHGKLGVLEKMHETPICMSLYQSFATPCKGDITWVIIYYQLISEYLIKWKNLPVEDSTWEDENFIQKHLELISAEDNKFLKEMGMLGPFNASVSPLLLFLV